MSRLIKMSEVTERDREQLRRFGRDWISGFNDQSDEHMLLSARLYWWESVVVPR
jgi:hypothetical protein